MLGEWRDFPSYGNINSADIYDKSGIYHIVNDLGGGIANGILLVFNSGLTKSGDKQFALQIFYSQTNETLKVRVYWYGTWNNWKNIALT